MRWTKGDDWFITSHPYQISKAIIKEETKYSLWLLPDKTLIGIFSTSAAAKQAAEQEAKSSPI